jgi:hypothetical protein
LNCPGKNLARFRFNHFLNLLSRTTSEDDPDTASEMHNNNRTAIRTDSQTKFKKISANRLGTVFNSGSLNQPASL